MNDFLRLVLNRLQSSIMLIVLAIPLIVIGILVPYWTCKKRKKSFHWKKCLGIVMLAGYLLALLFLTLVRGDFGIRSVNLHLLRAWREAWNNFSLKSWLNVLLNVGMFVPLGFLLPLFFARFRRWHWTFISGFCISMFIELIQYWRGTGVCDVDDLFANSLGCITGYFAIMFILSALQKNKKWKTVATYGCLFLVPVVAVGSIFAIYEIKEYGNLTDAPTYTNQTKGVVWNLECQLPDIGEEFAVYRTQSLTTDQCDALAEDLAQTLGKSIDMGSYYQEMAYYHLRPTGILSVNYFGGGYGLSIGWLKEDETKWIEADRASLEQALEKFPLMIPKAAELVYEGEGWHSFSLDRVTDGAMMQDGVIRVRYAPDGEILAIKNNLLSYTYYGEVSIITSQEAYARLCAGKFRDEGYFERKELQKVNVTSCVLDFQIDTKGFCQPVYIFTLEAPDGSYSEQKMIPAMK